MGSVGPSKDAKNGVPGDAMSAADLAKALEALYAESATKRAAETLAKILASVPTEKTEETQAKSEPSKEKPKKTPKEKTEEKPSYEIKYLDRRYDSKDKRVYKERKMGEEDEQEKDWWKAHFMCEVRSYNKRNELDGASLLINAEPLRRLLADVITYFPWDPISYKNTNIKEPYHGLFFYREQIREVGLARFAEDAVSLAQLHTLLNWITSQFETEIEVVERCMSGSSKAVAYEHLWTLFPPKGIIYGKLLDQPRAFRVRYTNYETGEVPGLSLKVSFVDFDGERLGTRPTTLIVPEYNGTLDLEELNITPLSMLPNADTVRAELIARGRKFESYAGQHFLYYDGLAQKKVLAGYKRTSVNGRVMIDAKTYNRLEANEAFKAEELENADVSGKAKKETKAAGGETFVRDEDKYDTLSNEEALIATSTCRGYAFTSKRFLEFYVDMLKPITWNEKSFDELVLDAEVKQTVQALVATHAEQRDRLDDIVEGKGRGLVCVLHGPPGVGKTLTAECVAEYVRRPLYSVSSGDLGVDAAMLDEKLTRIMDMTSAWGAVLLIDEADVFLERRSLHELHRNALVSVFLRVLEYYKGILFLTTNRVQSFDEAFKSRIHVPLRYTNLGIESREQIWRNFCAKVPGGAEIDKAQFKKLAKHELNGRQIKNIIKAAESLVIFQKKQLSFEQLEHVAKIQSTFEEDLSRVDGVDYTAPGGVRKDADRENMFL